ncbi:MAG: Xaa-Pro aminopeptidase [Halofilum sp. (in: g-proteobacteria)]|nr:Xaa-Pro aminopeptidase [Halofilum sp. (in: g-proteobacteria)]
MDAQEYARRRRALMRMMDDDAIAILPAAPEAIRNRDVAYPYRQDSDLLYLTGFPEPEAIAVICPGREHGEFVLFCRERDPEREVWNGRRAGVEGAVAEYGADDAFPIGDADEILPGMIEGREQLYCTMGRYADFDRHVMSWVNEVRGQVRAGGHAPTEFIALDHVLHDMRLFKTRDEMRAMRRAARISVAAHQRAMRACRPGMHEYELEAEFWHEFRRNGAEPAYGLIVGGGANGCVLHYVTNADPLNEGDLVLIDAGAEYDGYAADITRTFPVNGRFSGPQREVYEIVLAAQKAAIEAAVAGRHWNDPHETARAILVQGLIDLGLLGGTVEECIEQESYRRFFMHRTGHWLGMDVHDVGDYKVDDDWRQLETGMCLTIEPGLYIAAGEDIPPQLQNIGIRIEDDVAITRGGNEVLTRELVKEADDIEALMREGR